MTKAITASQNALSLFLATLLILMTPGLVLLMPSFAFADSAEITQLGYSESPDSDIEIDTPGHFIVQTQNGSGDAENATTTVVIDLSDDGDDGTWYEATVGGSCNAELSGNQITISSAETTSQKAFCYSNDTPGEYTITASVNEGDSEAGLPAGVSDAVTTVTVFDPNAPEVEAENFNTHSGANYTGINVGFNIADFDEVTEVEVSLYNEEGDLIAQNTHNQTLLEFINDLDNETLSTPFFIQNLTYGTETHWTIGMNELTKFNKPTKAEIKVTDDSGTYSATNESLSESTADYEELFEDAVENERTGEIFATIQSALDDTDTLAGDTLIIKGDLVEPNPVAIDMDISIEGDGKPTVKIGSTVNASNGIFKVEDSVTFELSNIVLDGEGESVYYGVLSYGNTTISDVDFQNVIGGVSHTGIAIASFGGVIDGGAGAGTYAASTLTVENTAFDNINRIGILIKGTESTANIDGITYTGKGDVEELDYGVEVGAGGFAEINNSSISNNTGEVSPWTSAGVLVTSYYGEGSGLIITNSTIENSTAGIAVGYDEDISTVEARNNNIINNEYGVNSSATNASEVDVKENWWGSEAGPDTDTIDGVSEYEPWLCGPFEEDPATSNFGSCVEQTLNTVAVSGDTASAENEIGWLFNRDQNTQSPYEFNESESSIGDGALYVLPIENDINGNADKFIGEYFLKEEIANINEISYDFMIAGNGTEADANEFYMNVYANYGDSNENNYYDCKYDVVPQTGSAGGFTTFTFNPDTSYPVTGTGCPSIPSDMDDESDGSIVRMFAINVGDTSANDQGLAGYYDNVVVNTTETVTTFDFEAPDSEGPTLDSVVLDGQNVDNNHIRIENCEAIVQTYTVSDEIDLEATISDEESGVESAWYKVRKVTEGGCTQSSVFSSDRVDLYEDEGVWEANEGEELDTNEITAEGTYSIALVTKDSVGNESTRYIDIIVVNTEDNTNPVITNASLSDDLINSGDDNPTLTADIDGTGSNVADVQYRIHKSPFEQIDGYGWESVDAEDGNYDSMVESISSEIDVTGLEDGDYLVRVRAFDETGNKKSGVDVAFTVNNSVEDGETGSQSPEVEITTPISGETVNVGLSNNLLEIAGTAYDEDFRYYYCYVSEVGGGEVGARGDNCVTSWAEGTPSKTAFAETEEGTEDGTLGFVDLTGVPEGEYTAHLVAYDTEGNTSATSVNFVLDNTAPDTETTPVIATEEPIGVVSNNLDRSTGSVLGASITAGNGEELSDLYARLLVLLQRYYELLLLEAEAGV